MGGSHLDAGQPSPDGVKTGSREPVDEIATAQRQVRNVDRALQVPVTVPGGMTDGAEIRFARCVREFGLALARETSRLEEAGRVLGEEDPEITTSMVIKANEAVRNPGASENRISWVVIISQIAVVPTSLVSGVFGSYLTSPLRWAGCIAFGILAFVAQTHAVIALWRRK